MQYIYIQPSFQCHSYQNLESTTVVLLFLSSDNNKAAWLLSSSVSSYLLTSNLSAYFRFIDIGELQKWALRANKLIKRFSLDRQVAKNVLNLSISGLLIWLVVLWNYVIIQIRTRVIKVIWWKRIFLLLGFCADSWTCITIRLTIYTDTTEVNHSPSSSFFF